MRRDGYLYVIIKYERILYMVVILSLMENLLVEELGIYFKGVIGKLKLKYKL